MKNLRVFLSYSHADAADARRLKSALENRGLSVHIDQDAMSGSERIRPFIERSIVTTDATVCLVSTRSLASEWVAIETVEAFSAEPQGRPFIACYLDEGFLDRGFRSRVTDEIDKKIKSIDKYVVEHGEKKIDTDDLDQEKSRLYALRNNLGEILKRLRESLTLDVRGDALDNSVDVIVRTLEEHAAARDDREKGDSTSVVGVRKISAKVLAVDAAVAVLSATLIRDWLIPENLAIVGYIAVFVVVVGVSITFFSQEKRRSTSRRLGLTSLGCLVLLLGLQLTLVEKISPYGGDEGTHHFLRGFRLTSAGEKFLADPQIRSGSWSDFIADIGDAMIPSAWGWSYRAAAASYSLSYLGIVFCVVLALGGTDLGLVEDGADRWAHRRRKWFTRD